MSRLGRDERELLEAFEAEELKRPPVAADIQKRHQKSAEEMLKKDARINIQLFSKDLRALQKKARAEGIPCRR